MNKSIDWDIVVAEENARAGLHSGANLRGHQRAAAPAVQAPRQNGAVSWDDVVAEENAKLPPNAVIPGQRGSE